MAKRRMAVIIFLICFCFWLTPYYVMATSTTDASEPINVNQECTLTLTYACDGTVFEDISVKLYKIADVSSDFQYKLTSPFEQSELILNGIRTNGEWNVIRSTLEANIIANNINADTVAKTDSSGTVCFEELKPGLYLTTVGVITKGELMCYFDSALVALPGLNTEGNWQYQVTVASKSEIKPPIDKEIELKVLKLWKGDEERNSRPKNIEVEIFKDGESYQKVELSQDDNWSYSWKAKDDGAKWTVIERSTPSGYTMTVENRNNSFILTNTYTPKNPDGPFDAPQTGDTSNIMLYVILMIVSGCMLIILGIIGKRNAYEENK
ncbi:MAG: Cna B-type domain-containing protein [Clostridia bacterium]|nr:Cna B-type domain-containing protein [Clostridia bacterium]